jgi:hypothetical protein
MRRAAGQRANAASSEEARDEIFHECSGVQEAGCCCGLNC